MCLAVPNAIFQSPSGVLMLSCTNTDKTAVCCPLLSHRRSPRRA